MGIDQVVTLGRAMLIEVALLLAPILLLMVIISFAINLVQVLTSLQDQTLSSVPRLIITGGALFLMMPWMWRHLALYTVHMLGDFHAVLQ